MMKAGSISLWDYYQEYNAPIKTVFFCKFVPNQWTIFRNFEVYLGLSVL